MIYYLFIISFSIRSFEQNVWAPRIRYECADSELNLHLVSHEHKLYFVLFEWQFSFDNLLMSPVQCALSSHWNRFELIKKKCIKFSSLIKSKSLFVYYVYNVCWYSYPKAEPFNHLILFLDKLIWQLNMNVWAKHMGQMMNKNAHFISI